MSQKNHPKKGFANIVVLIIFLLTVGGAVVYFKNFPLTRTPEEVKQTADKETGTFASDIKPAKSNIIDTVLLDAARRKGRDAQRVGDIKTFQAILELYFDSCGGYPRVSTLTIVGSPQFDPSSSIGCPKGISLRSYLGDYLMKDFPVNPKPGGQDYQYCSETAPGSGKCGLPASGKAESYRIIFTLEGESLGLAPGAHVVTPKGIQ